jgi:hypothetical protein
MANWKNTYLSDENVRARCVAEFPTPQSLSYATMFQNKASRRIGQAPVNPARAMQNLASVSSGGLKVADLEQSYRDSIASAKRESINVTYWQTPAQQMINRPVFNVRVSRANAMPAGNALGGLVATGMSGTKTYAGGTPSSLGASSIPSQNPGSPGLTPIVFPPLGQSRSAPASPTPSRRHLQDLARIGLHPEYSDFKPGRTYTTGATRAERVIAGVESRPRGYPTPGVGPGLGERRSMRRDPEAGSSSVEDLV